MESTSAWQWSKMTLRLCDWTFTFEDAKSFESQKEGQRVLSDGSARKRQGLMFQRKAQLVVTLVCFVTCLAFCQRKIPPAGAIN